MQRVTLQSDGAYSVDETTDSVDALYGSDSAHLSDSEDSMDTSSPRGESPMPSISAFEGIGSWTENIPDRREYLRFQSPPVMPNNLPNNSREAKAGIRGINRTVGKKLLSAVFHCWRLTLLAAAVRMPDEAEYGQTSLGPTVHRRQLFDNISDADSLTRIEQQLNPYYTSLFPAEVDGVSATQTQKGDLENQRDSDRSIENLLNSNDHSRFLQFVLLMSVAGLSMILSYWLWKY